MKRFADILNLAALVLTFLPSCLNYAGILQATAMKHWMLAGTILWFASATWRNAQRVGN